MKGKITKECKFVPFQLTLDIETIKEARTLFHCFNHCDLMALIENSRYMMDIYSDEYDRNLCNEVGIRISDDIKNQGFKI